MEIKEKDNVTFELFEREGFKGIVDFIYSSKSKYSGFARILMSKGIFLHIPTKELKLASNFLSEVRELTSHITFNIFGTNLYLTSEIDKKQGSRVYLQVYYDCPCTKTEKLDRWKGGKHYLSEHMTEDEIVKRAYVAFEAAVKHEVMEGFKFGGTIVFNPHVSFRELLKISHKEVKRIPQEQSIVNFDV